jgi:hypothetical protein
MQPTFEHQKEEGQSNDQCFWQFRSLLLQKKVLQKKIKRPQVFSVIWANSLRKKGVFLVNQ